MCKEMLHEPLDDWHACHDLHKVCSYGLMQRQPALQTTLCYSALKICSLVTLKWSDVVSFCLQKAALARASAVQRSSKGSKSAKKE